MCNADIMPNWVDMCINADIQMLYALLCYESLIDEIFITGQLN
jgi:hypothetical protein